MSDEDRGSSGGIWAEIHKRIEALSLELVDEMTEEELKDLWYRRSIELSRAPEEEDRDGDRLKLVTFRLGRDRYGVSLDMVREILRAEGITGVPTAPAFVVGVTNLRGSILSVVDIRAFFSLPPVVQGPKSRILVVEGGGLTVGLIVERVDEIADVNTAEIKPPLSQSKGITEDYIRGIVTQRGEMLIVIDLKKILENPRLVVEEKV